MRAIAEPTVRAILLMCIGVTLGCGDIVSGDGCSAPGDPFLDAPDTCQGAGPAVISFTDASNIDNLQLINGVEVSVAPGARQATQDVSSLPPGSYQWAYDLVDGECRVTAVHSMRVLPPPSSALIASPAVCAGEPVTIRFGASAGISELHYNGGATDVSFDSNTNQGAYAGASTAPAGTWSWTQTDGDGCTGTFTAPSTVDAPTVPPSDLLASGSFCGDPSFVSLSWLGGPADVELRSASAGLSGTPTHLGATSPLNEILALGDYHWQVIRRGTGACTDESAVGPSFTVHPLPPSRPVTTPAICQGDVATIQFASGRGTGLSNLRYDGSTIDVTLDGPGDQGSFAGTTGAPFGVWTWDFTDANGCTDTFSAVNAVDPAPVTPHTLGTFGTLCGDPSAVSFSWGGGPSDIEISASGLTGTPTDRAVATPFNTDLPPGTYEWQVTNPGFGACGDRTTAGTGFTVLPPPASNFQSTPAACTGSPAEILFDAATGNDVSNLRLNGSANGVTLDGPGDRGTYSGSLIFPPTASWSWTYTGANGCSDTFTELMAVDTAPPASVGLATSGDTCGFPAAITFNWFIGPSDLEISTTGLTGVATVTDVAPPYTQSLWPGTYEWQVINPGGACADATTIGASFTVDGPPASNLDSLAAVCEGSSASILFETGTGVGVSLLKYDDATTSVTLDGPGDQGTFAGTAAAPSGTWSWAYTDDATGCTAPFSAVAPVDTAPSAAAPTGLLSPDGTENYEAPLSWDAAPPAPAGYEIELFTDCNDCATGCTGSSTSFSPTNTYRWPGLLPGTYSWRVRTTANACAPGAWACETFDVIPCSPSPPWHTMVGGSVADVGEAAAVTGSDDIVIVGRSRGDAGTSGLLQGFAGGSHDVYVAKVSAAGALLWHTMLGGSGAEWGLAVAVNGSDEVFLAGFTNSQDIGGLLRNNAGSSDYYVAKLNSDGTLAWHTTVGGSGGDNGYAIGLNAAGEVLVGGLSDGTGITGLLQAYHGGNYDYYVAKLTGAGALVWHTMVGGSDDDRGRGLAVSAAGEVILTGWSAGDAGMSGLLQANQGQEDGYVAKLNGDGTLAWHTMVGGAGRDFLEAVALSAGGDVYVAGSSDDATGMSGLLQGPQGDRDVYLVKLDTNGGLSWHTLLGGSDSDGAGALAVDAAGDVYLNGSSDAAGGMVGLRQTFAGGINDFYAAKVSAAGAVQWHTMAGDVGGDYGYAIAVTSNGEPILVGSSDSAMTGLINGFAGSADFYVARLCSNGHGP